jgi:hypothetical protein
MRAGKTSSLSGLAGLSIRGGHLFGKVICQHGDVLFASAQGRHEDGDDVQPPVEVFAEFAFLHHFGEIAVRGGDDADIDLDGLAAADALEGLLPMARRSFTCVLASISPISSRKRVPPSASSNRPMRRSCAPVKEPFSWPKSSLSRIWGERAAQWTVTSLALGRPLRWWMAWATSSLPVPLSPSIKTVARVGATCWMVPRMGFIISD